MAITISLAAQPRDSHMTPRALRRAQKVPGVLYGRAYPARHLQFDAPTITRVVRRAGTSHLVSLSVEGETDAQLALIREVQRDPVTSLILHVDLYAIVTGQSIRNVVPLVQRGKSPAVILGGIVSQLLDELEVECLPEDMPEAVEVDLEKLVGIHSRITVADLVIAPNVTVLTPANTVVANVTVQRMKMEVEAPEAAPAEEEEAAAEEAEEADKSES